MAPPIISKKVFSFLQQLEKNNHREWFQENKAQFVDAQAGVKSFALSLSGLIEHHDSIENTKVFRIYRDVRFSKNKTPYKTHFGVGFSRTKPALRGGYYLHISPGDSFLACGFWDPNPSDLFRIRKELEVSASAFREIIDTSSFKDVWGSLKGDELKTCPKGFEKTHPDIDLLRKKQWIFTISFSDNEVMSSTFEEKVNLAIMAVRPFVDFMSETLTTNLNGESVI
jgi:uncharacterized protein (TIGR02453 family)